MSILNRSNDPDHFRGRKDYSIPTPTPAPDMGAGLPNLIDESLLSVDEVPTNSLNLGPLDIALPNPNAPDKNFIVRLPANFGDMVENRELDGMTLYSIINGAVDFGSEAESILRKFTSEDVPFGKTFGSDFDSRGYDSFFRPEDLGSAFKETILDVGNLAEEGLMLGGNFLEEMDSSSCFWVCG